MGRRPDVNGRELVLRAALELFSREGPDAVSIRAVNRKAGLGPASVHYHFGTKEALIEAIIARHSPTVVADIFDRAQSLQQGEVTPRAVVEAFALPYWKLLSTNPEGWEWMRVIGWLMSSHAEQVRTPEVDALVVAAAHRCFPDSTPSDVEQTLQMAFQLLISHLTMQPRDRQGSTEWADGPEDLELSRLLAFLSGGLKEALAPSRIERHDLTPCR